MGGSTRPGSATVWTPPLRGAREGGGVRDPEVPRGEVGVHRSEGDRPGQGHVDRLHAPVQLHLGKERGAGQNPHGGPRPARITPGAGPACEQDFVVSFFVPFADQANPTPGGDASPDVYIEDRAAMDTVYVASYGGWSSESSVISNA